MVAPISTDKPLSADESRTSAENRAGERISNPVAQESRTPAAEPSSTKPVSDTATVDRAAQLYRQANLAVPEGETSISTPEQAQQLASQIVRQMGEQAEQAFHTQAGGVSVDLTALLETAPV